MNRYTYPMAFPREKAAWAKAAAGPRCTALGCNERARYQVTVEVTLDRAEDEQVNACDAHKNDAEGLLAGLEYMRHAADVARNLAKSDGSLQQAYDHRAMRDQVRFNNSGI